jgi:hypothetical protein
MNTYARNYIYIYIYIYTCIYKVRFSAMFVEILTSGMTIIENGNMDAVDAIHVM